MESRYKRIHTVAPGVSVLELIAPGIALSGEGVSVSISFIFKLNETEHLLEVPEDTSILPGFVR